MKKLYIAIVCVASSLIYADKTQNPYYELINEAAGSFFKAFPSDDLDALLGGTEAKSITKATEETLQALVKSLQEELVLIYEQNKDKITNKDEFLMLQMNYVNLALYRLIYEEAEHRSLAIVAKVPNPNILEESLQQEYAQLQQSL